MRLVGFLVKIFFAEKLKLNGKKGGQEGKIWDAGGYRARLGIVYRATFAFKFVHFLIFMRDNTEACRGIKTNLRGSIL